MMETTRRGNTLSTMSETSLKNPQNEMRRFIVVPDSDSSLDGSFMSELDDPIVFHKTGMASKLDKLKSPPDYDSGVYCCPSDTMESPNTNQRPENSLRSLGGALAHKPARKIRKDAAVRWKKGVGESLPLECSEDGDASKTRSLRKPEIRRKRAITVEKIMSANVKGKTLEIEDKGDVASDVHTSTQDPLFCASTPRKQSRKRRRQTVDPADDVVVKPVCKTSTGISPVRSVSKTVLVQRSYPESMLHHTSLGTGQQARRFAARKAVLPAREPNSRAGLAAAAAPPAHPFSSQTSSTRPLRRFRIVTDSDSEPEDVPAPRLSSPTSCGVSVSKTSAHRPPHAADSVRDPPPPESRTGPQLPRRGRKTVDGAGPDRQRGSKRAAQTRTQARWPTAKHRNGARRNVKHSSEREEPVKKTGVRRASARSPGRCRKAGDRASRKSSKKPAGKPARANPPHTKTREPAKGERPEQGKAVGGRRLRSGRTSEKRTQGKQTPCKDKEETEKANFWPSLAKKTPAKKTGLRKKSAALKKCSRKKTARATSGTLARKSKDADSPKLPLVEEFRPTAGPSTERYRVEQLAFLCQLSRAPDSQADDIFCSGGLGDPAPAPGGLLQLPPGQMQAAVTPSTSGRHVYSSISTYTPNVVLAQAALQLGVKTPTLGSNLISPGNPLNSGQLAKAARYQVRRKRTRRAPLRRRIQEASATSGPAISSDVNQMAEMIGKEAGNLLNQESGEESWDDYFEMEA